MDGQEPDLLEVTVEPDPPILVVGIGVLVIVGVLALVLGRLTLVLKMENPGQPSSCPGSAA
jgi:hypothetical protein